MVQSSNHQRLDWLSLLEESEEAWRRGSAIPEENHDFTHTIIE